VSRGDLKAFGGIDALPERLPEPGELVGVRSRRWLVEKVVADGERSPVVSLACAEDDAQGESLDVLWDYEIDRRILVEEGWDDLASRGFDDPRYFAAFLNTVRWSSVTATDPSLFQAPFRAGIKIEAYQMEPLRKALRLPRANLFIADDTGLGKTIEAGLIARELLLRKKAKTIVVAAPPSVLEQWQAELDERFGLRFEILDRHYFARVRRERGFAVNPWCTHSRFLVSHNLLGDPTYADPMRSWLGPLLPGSLLILDEAHHAAPSSGGRYGIETKFTRAVRDLGGRFEHRLFLSATPHNGHSNSFSTLLELLDPYRFTRGVKVRGKQALGDVMVRRLKEDIREIQGGFPKRIIERVVIDGLPDDAPELVLSRLLDEYRTTRETRFASTSNRAQAAAGLLVVGLQQRLLSSIEAFARSLAVHRRTIERQADQAAAEEQALEQAAQLTTTPGSDDERGDWTGEELDQDEAAQIEAVTHATEAAAPRDAAARALWRREQALLDQMQEIAQASRHTPDHKTLRLLEWIREHLCPGLAKPGARQRARGPWTERRVLIFTENREGTKRYLESILEQAIEGTDQADERIAVITGLTAGAQRKEIQRRFNTHPADDPLRILLATDAAREGLNFQAHCADLFHFDIPWNPARMEQRNGRIDRTLQPSPEVRCHYFFYPQRSEDRVLSVLVGKVETIRKELGSLSDLLLGRFAEVLDRGLSPTSEAELRAAEAVGGRTATVREELESERADRAKLGKEIDDAGKILAASRQLLELDADLLRETLDAGLALAGAPPLSPVPSPPGDPPAFSVPPLPPNWQVTLDTLRPARARDEPPWEWRRRPLLPVVFDPLERLDGSRVHLHLQHPFVQRVLAPFLAQGYGAHDLSRVTALRDRHGDQVMAIAFGRLSLFGPGATRLHDELLTVAAPWFESRGPEHLAPLPEAAEQKVRDRLDRLFRELPGAGDPKAALPAGIQARLAATAAADFAALWPHVRDEADARVHEAERKLNDRAAKESTDLRRLLEAQRSAIRETLKASPQLTLTLTPQVPREREQIRQIDEDRAWQERRLVEIDRELTTEPAAVAGLYKIALRRLEPVGLVYLWPETRT